MKAALLFRSLILAGLLSAPALATNVVVSNISPSGTGDATLGSANGTPLPAGSFVRLGTFPGLNLPDVAELAQQGPSTLLAAMAPFGPVFGVGTGAGGSAGSVEFTASQAVAAQQKALHAVILNGATVESSTELLVLRIGEILPADDASGLPAYLAVHLRDAGVVFGTDTAEGFSTKASGTVPETFEAWIASQLGAGASAGDLLAEADPDRDGISNLLEYAFGSGAADGGSITQLEIHQSGGQYFARYLRRMGDSSLQLDCEIESQLEAETWSALETTPTILAEPPAPAGYERVQQLLPTAGHIFARLRATRSGE